MDVGEGENTLSVIYLYDNQPLSLILRANTEGVLHLIYEELNADYGLICLKSAFLIFMLIFFQ